MIRRLILMGAAVGALALAGPVAAATPPTPFGCGPACQPHQSAYPVVPAVVDVAPTAASHAAALFALVHQPVGALGPEFVGEQRAADIIWDHAPGDPAAQLSYLWRLLHAPVGAYGRALIPAQRAADVLDGAWGGMGG